MGTSKSVTMARDHREWKKIVLEARCITNRSVWPEAGGEEKKTKKNKNKYNNNDEEKDHKKDSKTMARDHRELKKIVLEARCITNRSVWPEAGEEEEEEQEEQEQVQ